MRNFTNVTTNAKVAVYRSCEEIFSGLIKEMRELSKKKPDATLNKGKVNIINRALGDVRSFLTAEPEAKYLDLLDDQDLPQNSDAVLIMVQYESALAAFKARYFVSYDRDLGHNVWITESVVGKK